MSLGLEGNSESVSEQNDHFRIWRVDSAESKALLAKLLPDPDVLFSQGEALASPWQGTATDKTRISLGGLNYFLKRYNCVGWVYRFKNVFRPSKALWSWRVFRRFLDLDIPTPPPLLCLEERRFRLLGRSYLLFPFIEGGAGALLDLWPGLTTDEQSECLVRLAEIIGRMHRRGVLHGDLNWRNVLARRGEEGLEFSLVDLDGSRLFSRPDREAMMRDLAHFLRDMERSEVPSSLYAVFLKVWREELDRS